MNGKKSIAAAIFFLAAGLASAEEAATLEQAKKLSVQSGKPILFKFFKEG